MRLVFLNKQSRILNKIIQMTCTQLVYKCLSKSIINIIMEMVSIDFLVTNLFLIQSKALRKEKKILRKSKQQKGGESNIKGVFGNYL